MELKKLLFAIAAHYRSRVDDKSLRHEDRRYLVQKSYFYFQQAMDI